MSDAEGEYGEAPIIFDCGTATTRVGVTGDSAPTLVLPTVTGTPAKSNKLFKKKDAGGDLPAHLVGDDVVSNLHRVAAIHPVTHGAVTDWSEMEKLWEFCYKELDITSDSRGVVVTEPPFNAKNISERIAQTFFETFSVESLGLVQQGICSLYASGRTTGIVLESGDGVTHVTPVFDSYPLMHAANRINFGGDDVTKHLKRLLYDRGYNFANNADYFQVRGIKQDTCYVASDYDEELRAEEQTVSFELPDGTQIELGRERFRAAEILFQPMQIQSELPSLQQFVCDAVKKCAIDTRKGLLANIVLSGGNTMFPGLPKRLQEEVVKQHPGLFTSIKVITNNEPTFAAWSGASVLASLSTFRQSFVTREVYEEYGPDAIFGARGGGEAEGGAED
jgi:actin, other eukaryote